MAFWPRFVDPVVAEPLWGLARRLGSATTTPQVNVNSLLKDRHRDNARAPHTSSTIGVNGSGERPANITELTPNEFISSLGEKNIRRFFIHPQHPTAARVSHPGLRGLEGALNSGHLHYKKHEGIFVGLGQRTGCLLAAFIWNTNRGQAAGDVSLRIYHSIKDFLTDGLWSSFLSGIRHALAGVWAGGGKGIIVQPEDNKHMQPGFRQQLFQDYGDFVTSLNGSFIASCGVGTNITDLHNVYHRSRFTTSVSQDIGGCGNSSAYTGLGVVRAMEAALEFLEMGSLEGKSVAIQGAGQVGEVIIKELLGHHIKKVYVTECNQKRVDDLNDMFSEKSHGRLLIEKVPFDDDSILKYPCDIFSPCATGQIFNKETISQMKMRIVCGSANQLQTDEDSKTLAEHGITYITEYLANRMDAVNCVLEPYGRLPKDPEIEKHLSKDWENSIFQMTKKILKLAKDKDISMSAATIHLGEQLCRVQHPLYPGRTMQIIDHLIQQGWQDGRDFWKG